MLKPVCELTNTRIATVGNNNTISSRHAIEYPLATRLTVTASNSNVHVPKEFHCQRIEV